MKKLKIAVTKVFAVTLGLLLCTATTLVGAIIIAALLKFLIFLIGA